MYAIILTGGSATYNPKSVKHLRGKFIVDKDVPKPIAIIKDKESAKVKAKACNNHLSRNEKKYFGMKYQIAEFENAVYTGRS